MLNYLSSFFSNPAPVFTPLAIDAPSSLSTLNGQEIPKEIVLQIFSYLNCKELTICSEVSKKEWRPLANNPLLLKKAIFTEKLCNSSYDKNAYDSLPSDIGQTYKKLSSKYHVIWLQKGRDYNKLKEVPLQFPITNNIDMLSNNVLMTNTEKLKPIDKSWVLVPKDFVWINGFETDEVMQKKMDDKYKNDLGDCELPTVLEMISIINAFASNNLQLPFLELSIVCKDHEKFLVEHKISSVNLSTYGVSMGDYNMHLLGIKKLA